MTKDNEGWAQIVESQLEPGGTGRDESANIFRHKLTKKIFRKGIEKIPGWQVNFDE